MDLCEDPKSVRGVHFVALLGMPKFGSEPKSKPQMPEPNLQDASIGMDLLENLVNVG